MSERDKAATKLELVPPAVTRLDDYRPDPDDAPDEDAPAAA